MLINLYSTE